MLEKRCALLVEQLAAASKVHDTSAVTATAQLSDDRLQGQLLFLKKQHERLGQPTALRMRLPQQVIREAQRGLPTDAGEPRQLAGEVVDDAQRNPIRTEA